MTQDYSIALLALSTQRMELETAARELSSDLDAAHSAETGVQAPVGRTSLREMLEGAVGEARANVSAGRDDVGHVINRIMNIENQSQDLDLRLGSGWETLPL